MNLITPRQQDYLDALRKLEAKLNRPPTQREIGEMIGVPQQSVSGRMRKLEQVGMVRRIKCQKWWMYVSNPDPVTVSKIDKLERWAREAASYLRRCNRFDLTRDLEGILNEAI